jgi:mRNA interferase MazF
MGAFANRQVIIFPFPYSDFSVQKLRPALLLADAGRGDWVLCQITSKANADKNAVMLTDADFTEGGLQRISYARPSKLFTANESIFQRRAGIITSNCYAKVIQTAVDLLQKGVSYE